jgi:carboxypeptidase C (cathepsin A)
VFQRILASAPGINVYDIRKKCEGPLCYDFSDADAFLNSAAVRRTLGVGDRKWEECNMLVNSQFYGKRAVK